MTNIKFILLVFFAFISLSAQDNSDLKSIGRFNEAISICINSMGNIYVLSSNQNSLVKLNPSGEIIESTGGYGWQASTFDNPTEVRSKNLTLYVADKNNHRIELFDRNLNYIGVIKSDDSDDITFSFPISVDINSQGDIFILDSENSRILKYDASGNISAVIGDYDAGDFILQSPADLSVTDNGLLLVLCQESLYVFDIFGNGISKINFSFKPLRIFSRQNKIFLSNENEVWLLDAFKIIEVPLKVYSLKNEDETISDISFFENILYVLTGKTIIPVNINNGN